jgi:hypothetical protein
MGIFQRIAELRRGPEGQEFDAGLKQSAHPRWVGEVTAASPREDGSWDLEAAIYTGEESPWQAPGTRSLRSRPPAGTEPRIGRRVVIRPPRHDSSQPEVLWDEPEPDLPPMFPNIPGGDDPKVMLEHLARLVDSGALDAEGYERARAYLERSG